ncbi:MAG TPA: hypothetical protein VNS46_16465 [Nocardioides sp.]|nr:hypothetical protein [Nocardioides sp.]
MMRFPVVGKVDRDDDGSCHFAMCQAPADFVVSLPRHEPMRVCSLHVTPVITWGWTDEDDDFPEIVAIAS